MVPIITENTMDTLKTILLTVTGIAMSVLAVIFVTFFGIAIFGAVLVVALGCVALGIMAEREMAAINVPIHRANEQARNR